jgi:ApaG protein
LSKENFQYSQTSELLQIEAAPFYIPERSSPVDNYFFYAYTIKITNHGQQRVQLISRHWLIRNGKKEENEVRGEGVVGEKPFIEPGESYQYTSFCPITTPTGNMRGKFKFKNEADLDFWVPIPLFFLRKPETFFPQAHA